MVRNAGWMRDLAFSYELARSTYPKDELLIVFDIDGTIVDERFLVHFLLAFYDREHETGYFADLAPEDISLPMGRMDEMLRSFGLNKDARDSVVAWCTSRAHTGAAVMEGHKPCKGVLDMIRWFQLQERTSVAINTSRPESSRVETLNMLNTLGRLYHVRFDDGLVIMNNAQSIPQAKASAIRRFKNMGYRVVAVFDSNLENLEAIAGMEDAPETLLIHTDLLWRSSPSRRGRKLFGVHACDITELVKPDGVPRHIEFAWHAVNDDATLRRFLVSPVKWAELHVRRNDAGSMVLRRRSYKDVPPSCDECLLDLNDVLYILREADRGVKLDLMDRGMIGQVCDILSALRFPDSHVWLTVSVEEAARGAFLPVEEAFPRSVRQCPVDGMGMTLSAAGALREGLGMLSRQGVNRFSVDWNAPGARELVIRLQNWGFDVNIYNVPDLESFLQAALLLPTSITSYFNFPKWFYTGEVHAAGIPDLARDAPDAPCFFSCMQDPSCIPGARRL